MPTTPRVFVIQAPARRERDGQGWVEKYNLEPAERFGELLRVLPYGNLPIDLEPSRRRLREAFLSYDFAADHVLLLGDPIAIALASIELALRRALLEELDGIPRPIRVLKWDRRAGCYASLFVS